MLGGNMNQIIYIFDFKAADRRFSLLKYGNVNIVQVLEAFQLNLVERVNILYEQNNILQDFWYSKGVSFVLHYDG